MNNTFVYTGGGRDAVPPDATHVIIHKSVKAISAEAFLKHPNVIEVYCHAGVKKVEENAFFRCPRLRRVVMPGVDEVWWNAFHDCKAIEYVECDNLEQIKEDAFSFCTSLRSFSLQSAKVIEGYAFSNCEVLTEAVFGANLEYVGEWAFRDCRSLERIVVPLKMNLFADVDDETFQGCANLRRVDLVEADELDETIAALHLEEWRNDITAEVGSINQILPNTEAGYYDDYEEEDIIGEKAIVLRGWISRVLSKIIDYKAQHVQLLEEAAETLQHIVPNDIVVENVIPFLKLPPHTFDGEED